MIFHIKLVNQGLYNGLTYGIFCAQEPFMKRWNGLENVWTSRAWPWNL